MATSIATEIGEDDPLAVIATTLAAYALSSILTGQLCSFSFHMLCCVSLNMRITIAGLVFFLLGVLKLGVIVGFFPRHILVGYASSLLRLHLNFMLMDHI